MGTSKDDDIPDRLRALSDIDLTKPSPARMYDYYLGGKDNFPADRAAAEKVLSVVPDGKRVAWNNRDFLIRTVRYMAENGIDQFLDLGTGIPTSPNVHEVAQDSNPLSRVAYVDNDPIVVIHDKAFLAQASARVTAVRGDFRYPLNILANHPVRELIDFSRPLGVLLLAVLHFVTDEENPYDLVAAFRDYVASGSCIAISHITSEGTSPDTIKTIREAYREASAPAVFRGRREICKFFNGLTLVDPGVVEVRKWRPDEKQTQDDSPAALPFLCGVGKKL